MGRQLGMLGRVQPVIDVVKLNAKESYAYSLYRSSVDELGPRAAYAHAVELAGLTTAAERGNVRRALAAPVVSLMSDGGAVRVRK